MKRCLRKGIGLRRLTLDLTLSKAEAVVNTRPLTYVNEEFESGFSLTPAHFLNSNLRCFPLIDTDINYCPSEDSMTTLLNKWKKGKKQLNIFWDIWRNEYLASLREASPYHKTLTNQIQVESRKGEVVLIKEDKIPRGMRKLGKIEKLNRGKDCNVRAVTIYLSNGHYVQRAINQLYPLEVAKHLLTPEEDNQMSDKVGEYSQHAGREISIRKAAITARKRINELLKTNALTIIFN